MNFTQKFALNFACKAYVSRLHWCLQVRLHQSLDWSSQKKLMFWKLLFLTQNKFHRWQSNAITRQPNNTSTQLSTTHLVWAKIFPVILLQILINEISSVLLDLAPDLNGVWWVKGHQGQPRGRHSKCNTYYPSWLQAATITLTLSSSSSMHTFRRQHTP